MSDARTLSENEEHAIAVAVWVEYQERQDRVKAMVYTVSIAALTAVLVGCAVPLSTMMDCKKDCSLASGLLTGVVLSTVLLALTVCVCCMECCFGEETTDVSDMNKEVIVRAINERREKCILLKERDEMMT